MLIYKKGDLLLTEGIIAHGCNCVGGFGSGVAGQISKKFPKARISYLKKHNTIGWKLGDVQLVNINKKIIIANCATQFNFLPRNQNHANYPAIKECFEKLKSHAIKNNLKISAPKIGAGLAGGDWSIIESILKEIFTDWDITIFTLD